MTTFFDLQFSNPLENCENKISWTMRARMTFKNGYAASVIFGPFSHGADEGKFEMAVIHYDKLCYASGITDDVIGYLDPDGVTEILQQIEALPERKDCPHERAK